MTAQESLERSILPNKLGPLGSQIVLDNRDANGVAIEVGMLVAWGDREGIVRIVHGPIPGTESTRDGIAVAYVQGLGYYGDFLAVRCNLLEIQTEVMA